MSATTRRDFGHVRSNSANASWMLASLWVALATSIPAAPAVLYAGLGPLRVAPRQFRLRNWNQRVKRDWLTRRQNLWVTAVVRPRAHREVPELFQRLLPAADG